MRRIFILTVAVLAVAAGAAGTSGAASADTGQHGAITITKDTDFTAPGSTTGCACVTAGHGTTTSPYVIGPWAIAAPSGGSSGWAIKVDNSGGGITSSFTISGISANYSGVPATDPVIVLVDVNNPAWTTISNVSANEAGRGVELDGSSYINLDQLSFNKMAGTGLRIYDSFYVKVSNSKFKSTADGQAEATHSADGIYALDSGNLSIGGVPACPASQICNSLDYDSGFGVYLKDTQYVTIEHASANADDTGGYVLDNSSNVSLGDSGAGSDGPICFNLNGTRTPTGYEISDLQGNLLLINGSHDNAIHNDQLAAPIGGPSIASGGNGFYHDPCTKSNIPYSPNPPEGPIGSNNTFTNVCYASTNIASLEPAQPCK